MKFSRVAHPDNEHRDKSIARVAMGAKDRAGSHGQRSSDRGLLQGRPSADGRLSFPPKQKAAEFLGSETLRYPLRMTIARARGTGVVVRQMRDMAHCGLAAPPGEAAKRAAMRPEGGYVELSLTREGGRRMVFAQG